MSTLRGFVDSVSDYRNQEDWIQVYNIPDTFSGSYELRQLTMYKGKELRTDFFEYYWAYNMRGTKLSSVWTWLVQLMFRKPKNIPGRIRWLYGLLWLIAVGYIVVLITGVLNWFQQLEWTQLPMVVLAGNAVLNIFAFVLTAFLGDAARYTYASPENIEERGKIRKGGIDLLHQLHVSKKYTRIVLVGHSLGSMIAYDMLKHYWSQVYKDYEVRPDYLRKQMDQYNEKSVAGFSMKNDAEVAAYMKLQSLLFSEQRKRGNPWLVTDLITLGSPLAHGELLMAETKEMFKERKRERELPSNPPQQEKNKTISYSQPFSRDPDSTVRDTPMEIIHHAGHFAFTRWHNLYYKRDYVGGPAREIFGAGMLDKQLTSTSWKDSLPFLMHTNYWANPKKSKTAAAESIAYLKKVILEMTKPEQ
ncbi:hypothetical protein KK083_16040 [Fulvivirgaceae bacterium PWU4]|uniref:Uncharacterized protein n=1 Tax=Chryseosolibacter histidini TaxID=2782349 RepID=A0AAP2DL77_9BACT|nr:hypothetical protein [Chryseosolibacter histidini]MBT1698401.1 hypothetical protein [Chryseosolibacter histidini]